jgi:hypothetical protein
MYNMSETRNPVTEGRLQGGGGGLQGLQGTRAGGSTISCCCHFCTCYVKRRSNPNPKFQRRSHPRVKHHRINTILRSVGARVESVALAWTHPSLPNQPHEWIQLFPLVQSSFSETLLCGLCGNRTPYLHVCEVEWSVRVQASTNRGC